MSEPDSIDMLRRDHSSLASTVSNLVTLLGSLEGRLSMLEKLVIEIQTDREVRKERDRNLSDRLGRIEKNISDLEAETKKGQDQIIGIGKWLLGAIGLLVIGTLYAAITGRLNVLPG